MVATCFPADQLAQKQAEGWFIVSGTHATQEICAAACVGSGTPPCPACPGTTSPLYHDLTFDTNGTGDFASLNGLSVQVLVVTGFPCSWAVSASGWLVQLQFAGSAYILSTDKPGIQGTWNGAGQTSCCEAVIIGNPVVNMGNGTLPSVVLVTPGPCV